MLNGTYHTSSKCVVIPLDTDRRNSPPSALECGTAVDKPEGSRELLPKLDLTRLTGMMKSLDIDKQSSSPYALQGETEVDTLNVTHCPSLSSSADVVTSLDIDKLSNPRHIIEGGNMSRPIVAAGVAQASVGDSTLTLPNDTAHEQVARDLLPEVVMLNDGDESCCGGEEFEPRVFRQRKTSLDYLYSQSTDWDFRELAQDEHAPLGEGRGKAQAASLQAQSHELQGASTEVQGTSGRPCMVSRQDSKVGSDATEKLWKIFKLCDTSGDGQINKRELIKVCAKRPEVAAFFGLPMHIRAEDGSRDKMELLFQKIDKNDDREITWLEFRSFYADTVLNMAQGSDEATPQSPNRATSTSSGMQTMEAFLEGYSQVADKGGAASGRNTSLRTAPLDASRLPSPPSTPTLSPVSKSGAEDLDEEADADKSELSTRPASMESTPVRQISSVYVSA
eukprot:gnl/TRDRNA2_/TRDRNA2_73846_c0_seq1.p1 gnl/TRDRNA2_/TRDRNA2_73846_c0~~gnl/TRDRNA2_/TRDRNA2_73846_c0_seq1.p1  ORF type:complete len:450 (+),score=66.19 gnl/TRDRNA2_/TRDRNA2_73846_c0_seq1:629-1978(+)